MFFFSLTSRLDYHQIWAKLNHEFGPKVSKKAYKLGEMGDKRKGISLGLHVCEPKARKQQQFMAKYCDPFSTKGARHTSHTWVCVSYKCVCEDKAKKKPACTKLLLP